MVAFSRARFVPGVRGSALHQETHRLQAIALFNRVTDSESVVFGAGQQDGVQIVGEPPHVLHVVRIGDFNVLLRNCRVRPSNPLDQLVRLRRGDAQIGHQLRFPLRVLQLVTLERYGTANASGVREPRVPAAAANQHCQRVVLLLHTAPCASRPRGAAAPP